MKNEWILDVLDDLTIFASKNGLAALEQQLLVASGVAAAEMAASQGVKVQTPQGRGPTHVGRLYRTLERSAHAG